MKELLEWNKQYGINARDDSTQTRKKNTEIFSIIRVTHRFLY